MRSNLSFIRYFLPRSGKARLFILLIGLVSAAAFYSTQHIYHYLPDFIQQLLASPPKNFDQAKEKMRWYVYHDRHISSEGDLYCGCQWSWGDGVSGQFLLDHCGYQVRRNEERAYRLEYEHIKTAHALAHQLPCWIEGGRSNCRADPLFREMESNMHNLTPTVGEVNGDRSNFMFSDGLPSLNQYGSCNMTVDFANRLAEPRDESKGLIARVYFYMHDRYQLPMEKWQEDLFLRWDREHPVTPWELERDRRIGRIMGHRNPYVSGNKTWGQPEDKKDKLQHNSSHPIPGEAAPGQAISAVPLEQQPDEATTQVNQNHKAADEPKYKADPVIGNKRSQRYHLSHCPSYLAVSRRNKVLFDSEEKAIDEGFILAGNCRPLENAEQHN